MIFALNLFVLVGCSEEEVVSEPPVATTTLPEFAAAYGEALCRAATETCAEEAPWLSGRTFEDCTDGLARTFDADGCLFDAEQAEECLAALENAECADVATGGVDACANVVVGTDGVCSVDGSVMAMSDVQGATYAVEWGFAEVPEGTEIRQGSLFQLAMRAFDQAGMWIETSAPDRQLALKSAFTTDDGTRRSCVSAMDWGLFLEENPWMYPGSVRERSATYVFDGLDVDFRIEDATIEARAAEDASALLDVRFAGRWDSRPYDAAMGDDFCQFATMISTETCVPCADGEPRCVEFDFRFERAPRVEASIDDYDPAADPECG